MIDRVLQEQSTIDFEYSLQLDDPPLDAAHEETPSHRAAAPIWFSVNISPISDSSVIWIARDVTHRKKTEEEILYAKEELAQITLQSIGDRAIATDASGQIQYLNPTAEQLTAWSAREAQGQPLTKVFCLINETTKKATASRSDRQSDRSSLA